MEIKRVVKTQSQLRRELHVQSLDDLKNVDINAVLAVDPERTDLGTKFPDCALIARTYERGAHFTPTEAAVFAPFNRHIENHKIMSQSVAKMLSTYMFNPEDIVSSDVQKLAAKAGIEVPGGADSGTGGKTDEDLQSLNIGKEQHSTKNTDKGGGGSNAFMDWLSECIPCDLRLGAWIEFNPNLDLLGMLENFLMEALKFLTGIGNILSNLDLFGDFCKLLDLLSFMCIPDLQRIIMLFISLLTLEAPNLDFLIGFLMSLVGPLFSAIFSGIIGLFDQFVLLVVNPLDCIVDAINQQLAKLPHDPTQPPPQIGKDSILAETAAGLDNALRTLKRTLEGGIATIKEKLDMYLGEFKALLGEVGGGDFNYLVKTFEKLTMVRLIGFIIALILALTKGDVQCSGGKAEKREIDAFFENYLSPNGAFDISMDDEGNINISERVPEQADTLASIPQALSNIENVFEFEGEDVIVTDAIRDTVSALIEPVRVKTPCRLEVSADEADKVNQYISELNMT